MLGVLGLVALVAGIYTSQKAYSGKTYSMEKAVRKMYPGRSEKFIQKMIAKQKQHRYDIGHYSPGETTYEDLQKKSKGRFGSLRSKFKRPHFKKYF